MIDTAHPLTPEPPGPPQEVSDLTRATDTQGFSAFHPAALRLWQINSVIGNFLLVGGLAVGCSGVLIEWHLSPAGFTIVIASVGVLTGIEMTWLLPRRYQNASWRITTSGLEVRRGAFIRRERLYPLPAVLFVEKRSGPVARHFGVISIHVHDITGSHEFGQVSEESAREIIEMVAHQASGFAPRPGSEP